MKLSQATINHRQKPHDSPALSSTNHPRRGATGLGKLLGKKTNIAESDLSWLTKVYRNNMFKPEVEEDIDSLQEKMKAAGIANAQKLSVRTNFGLVEYIFAKNPKDSNLALFVPGQKGNLAEHIESGEIKQLWDRGKSICLASYRGYHSNGKRIEASHESRTQSLESILLKIRSKYDESQIEIHANSMGCNTATNALARRRQKGLDTQDYALIDYRAPFTNTREIAKHYIDTKAGLILFRPGAKFHLNRLQAELGEDSFVNLEHVKADSFHVSFSEADAKIPWQQSMQVVEKIKELNPKSHITKNHLPRFYDISHHDVCFSPEQIYKLI